MVGEKQAEESLRASIALLFRRIFADQIRRTAIEWAEQVRRMESGRRYRIGFAPYQKEMMETPYRPDVQMTVFEMFSRGGKSEVALNIIGHAIDEEARRILIMYPTISQAEKFSKDVLMKELVNPTPSLAELIGDDTGRRKSGNTILHKMYPGGIINIFGSNAPGEMRRAKGNLLYADEIDAIKETEGDEGDQLDIFWMRGSEYPDTVKIACSYPSLKGRSRIRALMIGSDFRRLRTNCPRCGHDYEMERKQIWYPHNEPEKAEMRCPSCDAGLSDDDRRGMVQEARWVPTQPFNGVAGFHANAMYSPHPPQKGFVSHLHFLADLALKAEKAPNPDRARMVIANTVDAEPYEPDTEKKPEPDELLERREDYDPSVELPAGIRVLTCGIDCQEKGRIELEVVGFGEDFRTWGVRYHVLTGSLQQSRIWRELDEFLLREWKHPLCGSLKIAAAFVDSGHAQTQVLRFTRPRKPRRIYAIKGSSRLGVPLIGAPSKIGKGSGMAYQFTLGTHEAKDVIYQRLELKREEGEQEFPVGYMHFPRNEEYGAKYFAGLLAEDVTMKRGLDGDWYRYFENTKRLPNEPLDCFDAETEVLTKDGWRLFSELSGSENLATVNLSTDKIEYQKPLHLISRHHVGEMVSLQGARLDVLVTPGHRMVTYKKEFDYVAKKWNFDVPPKITLAKDLTIHHQVKTRASWDGICPEFITVPASFKDNQGAMIDSEKHIDPVLFAKFLGWYVSEGGRFKGRSKTQGNMRYRVEISQTKKGEIAKIMQIVEMLPWKFRMNKCNGEGMKIVCSSKQLHDYLDNCGAGVYSKMVPQWIKDGSPEIILAFLDAAVSGDGWTCQKESHHKPFRSYATISRKLADDIQELFLKVGKSSNIKAHPAKPYKIRGRTGTNTRAQYHVTEINRKAASLDSSISGKRAYLGKNVEYDGMVYCATVPNETLIVRRNGRAFIAGNCRVYAMAAERMLDPHYDAITQRMLAEREPKKPAHPPIQRTPVPIPSRPQGNQFGGFSVRNW